MNQKKHPDHAPGHEPSLDSVPDGSGSRDESRTTATVDPDPVVALKRDLETAKVEAAADRDRFLRAKAETENIRRRAEADVANVRKFALESFATEILGVRDNLERAQAVDLKVADVVPKVVEGLTLTLGQLDAVLDRFGLTAIDPKGERFDPERHQAMTLAETTEVPPGHILYVAQKGYLLNGRLLRPAMVIVAKEQG